MVITDLDGTLLKADRTVAAQDLKTLQGLSSCGVVRAIATGRSLYSALKVLAADFPIDYLLFSSGAGIVSWPDRGLLRASGLSRAEAEEAAGILQRRGLDFMIHEPIPENHRFRFSRSGRPNPDFERRLALYRAFASPWQPGESLPEGSCQLLAVAGGREGIRLFEELRAELEGFQLIRSTSPLDGESLWIEIFPRGVSKAGAGAWLAERLGILPRRVLALGNDYNDLDLLQWAGSSFVVENAAGVLKASFPSVPSNDHGGFSRAVKRWLES